MGVKNSNCKEPQKNLTFALPHRVFLAHLIHSPSDVGLMRADSPSVLFTTVSPGLMAWLALAVSDRQLEKSSMRPQGWKHLFQMEMKYSANSTQWLPKWGPHTSSSSSIWELVRNTNSLTLLQTYWAGASGDGVPIPVFEQVLPVILSASYWDHPMKKISSQAQLGFAAAGPNHINPAILVQTCTYKSRMSVWKATFFF